MTLPHGLRLLAAGILAIPALLLLVTIAPFVAVLSVPSLAILVRRRRDFATSPIISSLLLPRHSPPPSRGGDHPASSLDDDGDRIRRSPLLRHAIITGGSSGIGLSIAIELARRGCRNITLVARREDQLACARRSVEEAASAASDVTSNNTMAAVAVRTVSVDVTDHKALESSIEGLLVGGAFDGSRKDVQAMVDDERDSPLPGPPTLLFHCAGYSNPLAFVDHTASDFRDMVEVNYLGTVHVVMSVLPHMTNGGGGNMILTSSMSGQAGTYGYSAYSPTKFALRGFAECLSMELAANGSNVHVSLSYPPDTRTPGYENENRNKPEECRLISESAGVWDPDIVGRGIVDKALRANPPFDIYFGIDGWMLSMLTSGMTPVTSELDAICQVALMGLLRFVSLFYLMDFGRITQGCYAGSATARSPQKEHRDSCCKDD